MINPMHNKLTTFKNRLAVFCNYTGVHMAQKGAVKLAKKLVFYAIALNPNYAEYRNNYRLVMTYKKTSMPLNNF